ncbi:MAG: hypothetical protein ACOC0N_04295 [Chroococcales cyanobacterium]
MKNHESELRRSAEKAFQESLEQLSSLSEAEKAEKKEREKRDRPSPKPEPSSVDWEEAGKDLEEFFGEDDFS